MAATGLYTLTDGITIIQDGYYRQIPDSDDFEADSTVTLIKVDNVNIIVDTGGAWRRQAIVDALKHKIGSLDSITHVICTHGHSDHCGNLNLFPDAVQVVGFDMNNHQRYIVNQLKDGEAVELVNGRIRIVPTPGHTCEDVSVLVYDEENCRCVAAITGDLFECKEDILDESIWRSNSQNPEIQAKSRKYILEQCKPDYIIPGHGPPFKNE